MTQEFIPDSDFAALETPRVANKLQSLTALARFEFEAGKSHEGTKILMVEWEDDDLTRPSSGSWHVSWDGKQTVLPADDHQHANNAAADHVRRCYFLLPPQATVPPNLTLTYEPPPNSASTVRSPDSIQVNPLPAIFPPELGATARTAGKKGVLHTIWAKKRLQVLRNEVKEESTYNPEGVALAMAVQEMEWIESNFGVGAKPPTSDNTSTTSSSVINAPPLSPTTPISPTGGGSRLSEKLKGLKLGTSEKDLTRKSTANQNTDAHLHPLSPDEPDVAISSFSSFHSTPLQPKQQQQQQQPSPPQEQEKQQEKQPPTTKQPVAHAPPDFIQFQQQEQQQSGQGFASLSMQPIGTTASTPDTGEGLFAKALSPRSPDIPKSPFSFSSEETIPYAKKELNA